MDDRDVRIVEEYIQTLPEATALDSREIFRSHVYSRWAAYEILERVISEAMKLPEHISGKEILSLEEVIDSFIDEMDYFISVSGTARAKTIFQIALDEGLCMKLYICSRKELDNENRY